MSEHSIPDAIEAAIRALEEEVGYLVVGGEKGMDNTEQEKCVDAARQALRDAIAEAIREAKSVP